MKIAFFSTMEGYPWGGSEELWSRAALHLRARGVEVVANVLRWEQTPSALTRLQAAGVQVHRRLPRRDTFLIRQFRRFGVLPRNPDLEWLKAQRPDLVVFSLGCNFEGTSMMQGCRALGLRYALINQAVQESWLPNDEAKRQLREVYENATACYCLAVSNLRSLQRQLASPLPSSRVIRNPFNLDYHVSVPAPLDEGPIRLALVARLEPYAKGHDVLFEVLAADKWQQRPLRIALYGDGPLRGYLRELADYYGLKNVEFSGVTDDIPGIWARHHALLLPSRIEGMPLSAIEAMMCGRPCIVTQVAACEGELVEDGVTGFVAKAATVTCLDDALERAWANRAQWPEMGRRASEHVRRLIPPDPAAVLSEQLQSLAISAHA